MWIHDGKELADIPEGAHSFVYRLELSHQEHHQRYWYFGKKAFYKSIKRPPLKGKKRHRRDTVESNWRKYCSSSSKIKELASEGWEVIRFIERICYSAKEATWFENKLIISSLHYEDCLNDNVSGKFFKEEVREWNKRND